MYGEKNRFYLPTYIFIEEAMAECIDCSYSSQNRNFGLTSDQKARGKLMIGEMPDTVVVNVKKIIIIILIKHFISRNYSHSSAEV